jgi:hypothetical protein
MMWCSAPYSCRSGCAGGRSCSVELISVTLVMDKELRVAVGVIRASSVFRFP